MKKKLQVFISSTFKDLIDERQSAVEAVLSSGHIPAGMELFKAGDESQKETIKKWIDESDAYLLILGGRYGSIEPMSDKSYTHWEYDYAGEVGIPRFAVVIDKVALEEKVKLIGTDAIELDNKPKYEDFKKLVLSKTSEFYYDTKDIKLTIHRKLAELGSSEHLLGWISAKNITTNETLVSEIARLIEENNELKKKILDSKSMGTSTKDNEMLVDKLVTTKFVGNIKNRLGRIFAILNAESQEEYSYISWTENGEGEGEEDKEIMISTPPIGFTAYFVMNIDTIEELLIVGIINSHLSYIDSLAEIRVMLSEYQKLDENSMKIRFILALEGEHPEKVAYASDFFEKALSHSNIENKESFELEIWDETQLEKIEKRMALTL